MPTYYPQLLRSRLLSDATRAGLAADDANVTAWHKGDKIILATQVGYNGKDTAAGYYRLDWRNVTDGGSFAPVAATGQIKWSATSAVLADGTALTQANSRCTDPGNQTWQNGLENVADNRLPSAGTIDLGSDCFSEFQWALDTSSSLDGKQYEFRLWNLTSGVATGTCIAKVTIKAIATFVGVGALVTTTSSITLDIAGGGVYNPVGVASVVSTTSTPILAILRTLKGNLNLCTIVGTSPGGFDIESGDNLVYESGGYILQEIDTIDLGFGSSLVGVAAITTASSTPILNIARPLDGIGSLVTTTSLMDLLVSGSAELFGVITVATTTSSAILATLRPLDSISSLSSTTATPILVVTRPLAGIAAITSTTPSVTIQILKSIPGVISLDTVTNQPVLGVARVLDGVAASSSVTSDVTLFISGEASFLGAATIQSQTSTPILQVLRNLFLSGVSIVETTTGMPSLGGSLYLDGSVYLTTMKMPSSITLRRRHK